MSEENNIQQMKIDHLQLDAVQRLEFVNQEYVSNLLKSSLEISQEMDRWKFLSVIWALDSLDLLDSKIDRLETLDKISQMQSESGLWFEGEGHSVPITAQTSMALKRSAMTPKYDLDKFFSSIDTWEAVDAECVKTQQGDNYWGNMWGYVGCYAAMGEEIPWKDKLLDAILQDIDSWLTHSHQRTHIFVILLQSGLIDTIGNGLKEQMVSETISSQLDDGSWADLHWDEKAAQTGFNLFLLKVILRDKLLDLDRELVQTSIDSAIEYCKSCYREDPHTQTAGFANQSDSSKISVMMTSIVLTGLNAERAFQLYTG